MIITGALLTLVVFAAGQLLWARFNGQRIAAPTIPREIQIIGKGEPLRYLVMGDSTAVGQGGGYQRGYAVVTAKYIAAHHRVEWRNVAVSGATTKGVSRFQLSIAQEFKPDIALVAVGANDVTHVTALNSVRGSVETIITGLRRANPKVKIILTGSPDMGSVPRFAQPLRWLAGKRTEAVNRVVVEIAEAHKVTFAPIAAETGIIFRSRPDLFAADKFHPTNEGYEVWTPVLLEAFAREESKELEY